MAKRGKRAPTQGWMVERLKIKSQNLLGDDASSKFLPMGDPHYQNGSSAFWVLLNFDKVPLLFLAEFSPYSETLHNFLPNFYVYNTSVPFLLRNLPSTPVSFRVETGTSCFSLQDNCGGSHILEAQYFSPGKPPTFSVLHMIYHGC